MNHKTEIKIYEWLSFVCIIGATILCIYRTLQLLIIAALLLAIGMFLRMLMERTRRKACEEEIDELHNDLRRLTKLYAESQQKKNN